jgi:hypothetical protein
VIFQVAGQLGLTVLHDHNYAIPEENVSVSVLTGIGWVAKLVANTFRDRRPCTTACPGCWAMGDTYIEIVYVEGKNILYLAG